MVSNLDRLTFNFNDDQCKVHREFYTRDEVSETEYIDSWEKFKQTKLLPKNPFYSKLNIKGISDQDYEYAQQVWYRIKTEL